MEELIMRDPELAKAIELECGRQMGKLELIASENFISTAVRQAQGSVLTHKYAEGYAHKRYYSERLLYLPDAMWCYTPPQAAPEPVAGRETGGAPTFGVFNNFRITSYNVCYTKLLRASAECRSRRAACGASSARRASQTEKTRSH